jgi:uncharacterized lipoprotein YehR (DUF1307 family)
MNAMNILRPLKFYLDEALEFHSINKKNNWDQNLKLEKIDEQSEQTKISLDLSSIADIESSDKSSYTIENSVVEKTPDLFFCNFLEKLTGHPKIFNYFRINALKSNVIRRSTSKERTRAVIKALNVPIKTYKNSFSDRSSEITDISIPKSRSARRGVVLNQPSSFKSIKSNLISTPLRSESKKRTSTPISRIRTNRLKSLLKLDDPKLQKIFKTISESAKITLEDFKNYLCLRYTPSISDSMCKFFSFRSGTYEDYISEMNRFISMSEERHLSFCFEVFDFDKDKLITYNDTFKAIENRINNYYDNDLVCIKDMLLLKTSGALKNIKNNRIQRRRSTFSIIREKNKNINAIEEKIEAESNKVLELAELNFKEFCMIRFHPRPQIFLDFLLHACNYNFLVEKGYLVPFPRSFVKTQSKNNPNDNLKDNSNSFIDYSATIKLENLVINN